MPTGYTADVADGKITTFEQFFTQCMRAFGACVEQRDDPLSNKPKLSDTRLASSYHYKELQKAKKRLARAKKRTLTQIKLMELKDAQKRYRDANIRIEENKNTAKRYDNMLKHAQAWVPPTSEHENLKKFMIDQLTESRKFDCGGDYYINERDRSMRKLIELDAKARKAELIESIEHDIEYHTKHLKEDIDRLTSRNNWITQALASLKPNA